MGFVAFTVRLAPTEFCLKLCVWGFLSYAMRIEHPATGLQGHPDWQECSRWLLHRADAVQAKVVKIREDAARPADGMAEAQKPQGQGMLAGIADIKQLLRHLQLSWVLPPRRRRALCCSRCLPRPPHHHPLACCRSPCLPRLSRKPLCLD